jgi:hypothetical protein
LLLLVLLPRFFSRKILTRVDERKLARLRPALAVRSISDTRVKPAERV